MAKVITVAQQKGGSGKTTVAVNLAVALSADGHRVAVVDTDPQGSLGQWYMTRLDAVGEGGDPGLEFATASAWGVGYEIKKLSRGYDWVVIDTPPKVDSDLRPALRESDLVLIPVATSQVDMWALDAIVDLVDRTGRPSMVVLNRYKKGTHLSGEIEAALSARDLARADAVLGERVVYAETLGQGRGVIESGKGPAASEVARLRDEVAAAVG